MMSVYAVLRKSLKNVVDNNMDSFDAKRIVLPAFTIGPSKVKWADLSVEDTKFQDLKMSFGLLN